jgi:hypothetical protein
MVGVETRQDEGGVVRREFGDFFSGKFFRLVVSPTTTPENHTRSLEGAAGAGRVGNAVRNVSTSPGQISGECYSSSDFLITPKR